jgi:hypothetical protein
MNNSGPLPLKLQAADKDDLAVLSAFLQDAVIPVKEASFIPAENRFVFVANRFRWEDADRDAAAEGTRIYERVHCVVCFQNVATVRQKGLEQRRRGQVVSLLSFNVEPGTIDLVLSAGALIQLEVGSILCHLLDLDDPWPTQWRPAHPLDAV